MKQETTLSQRYASVCLKRLRRVAKAVRQANGQHVKLRCLLKPTKKQAVATKADFYINLFSIFDPQIKKQKNKKGLKKNKKKNIGEIISHSGYIPKPSNS